MKRFSMTERFSLSKQVSGMKAIAMLGMAFMWVVSVFSLTACTSDSDLFGGDESGWENPGAPENGGNSGIRSDDYLMFRPGNHIYVKATAGNAIKANDAIYIKGGVINVETSAAASKGLSSDGLVQIDGGRTTAITTGTGELDEDGTDVSGCAGVKADSVFVMNGGELYCKSTGAGGKGISTDQTFTLNDGTIKVITTGQQYVYNRLDTSPKGIKSDGAILNPST